MSLWRASEHEPLTEREAVGHGRYTLFTGDIGVALYLRACLDVDPSFPTIDVL